jgi:DNA-binding transcriptional LysR family regulator
LNIRQLETFYWAAKLGSFTAAAERLHSTQSTVSMRILDLERVLGVALFDRSQRTSRLTAKGRALMGYAERLIELRREIQESIAAPEALSGLVRLGVAEVVSLTWLPRLVKTLHARYPRITLELDEALTGELMDKLRAGHLDIVLTSGRGRGLNFITRSLGTVDFRWMASPALALPPGPFYPRELAKWPIIALSRESYHHASIEQWFRGGKAVARRVDTCKSMGVAAALAAAGLGVTFLPVRCFRDRLEQRDLEIVETVPAMAPVEFTAMTLADRIEPITELIAEVAAEVSDFDAPGAAGGQRHPPFAISPEQPVAAKSPTAGKQIGSTAR